MFCNIAAQTFGYDLSMCQVRFWQQQCKLLAADAGEHIGIAFAGARQRRKMNDHLIADFMPETVIDRFEKIDVDHQE